MLVLSLDRYSIPDTVKVPLLREFCAKIKDSLYLIMPRVFHWRSRTVVRCSRAATWSSPECIVLWDRVEAGPIAVLVRSWVGPVFLQI
jgi:hypothetical protein